MLEWGLFRQSLFSLEMEMTTAVYNGEVLNLAKLTIGTQMKFVEIDAEQNLIVKAELMYATMNEVVGDRLSEIVDGKDYVTCDLTTLSDLYYVVTDAYGADMHSAQLAKQSEQMNQVERLEEAIAMLNKAVGKATN